MNRLYLILSLVSLVAVAVFATINSDPVTVNLFWIKELDTTSAMLAIGALALGMIIMLPLHAMRGFRTGRELGKIKKQLKAAEQERDILTSRVAELGRTNSNIDTKTEQ
jgi:uncharacterized integral membrane protein